MRHRQPSDDTTRNTEVELKFRLEDPTEFLQRLEQIGAERLGPVEVHLDEYWAHPQRDFKSTKEALRIRSINGEHRLTYKGPPQEGAAKIRREIELPFGPGTPLQEIRELLSLLGFTPVARVAKIRRCFRVPAKSGRNSGPLVTIDQVNELGMFTELEWVCPSSDVAAAVADLSQLADGLGLRDPIRRSYLSLLLEQRSRQEKAESR